MSWADAAGFHQLIGVLVFCAIYAAFALWPRGPKQ